ncbi:restriction endonuclease subunit S [Burkholderia gladioli]|uniref:restriction endonuclease subunit S n=1 Tax=Burkholderia gladioli TaxID=28095 RepID=UPI0016406AB2|nr:restriction endonuclease subunit S [Burkholderia gladioli]
MSVDKPTIPFSWAVAQLSDVAGFEMGQAPPASECNVTGVGTIFVKAGEFGKDLPVVREWTTKPLKFAKSGDVLICVVGATSGKLNLGIDCAIGRSVAAIRPEPGIDTKLLYRQLMLQVKTLRSASTGSAQGVISKEMLARIEVAIPPEKEQRRIADKLGIMLARVDAVNERLERIAPLLNRFRQSVLAAAVAGKLTEDWRASVELDDSWRDTNVGGVIVDLRYGTSKKCDSTAVGTAVLRIPNVGPAGTIQLDNLKYANFDDKEREKLALEVEDLLVIRSNGSVDLVGRACIVDSRAAGMLFAGYLIRLRVDREKAIPKFLWLTLSGPAIRGRIEATARSTSGVNNINSEELKALPMRIPLREEQVEIVRRVELLFAYADRLEARLRAARTTTERLTPALLTKAFRGELMPQDPGDAPASELLRRLKANASSTRVKKDRKRSA